MTLGICISELAILNPVDQRNVLADAAEFGFRRVRFEVPWVTVQPKKGVWDWALVENARDIARKEGIELLPVLGVHCPTWKWTPVDVAIFATEATKVLQAPAYEIWNEMNLARYVKDGRAATYVPWLNAAYDAIHAAQWNAKVIMGGLAAAVDAKGFNVLPWLGPLGPWRNTSPETFLTAAVAAGARFDAVAYHPYSIGPGFDEQVPSAAQVMIARIPKLQAFLGAARPLVLTEWGFNLDKMKTSTAAQRFTTQLPLMGEDSYLYSWRHYGSLRYGLVDARNRPVQPYYDTVKAAFA